ncbi:MAG: SDR family oxidoreductase [Proteobacteria bacterium]|nr:SDR family oxidoreductase [Pseudomonadota bacterium]
MGTRVVIVTGGAKRIGRAISTRLAADGWAVAIHNRDAGAEADALAGELISSGAQAVVISADLTDEAEIRRAFKDAGQALGPVTAVVNNASVFEPDDARSEDRALWDLHMAVHVRAPFVLAQCLMAALPADRSGSVVNVIDQRVWNPTRHFTSYTLSKMALWDLTRVLARSLAPRVRVNGIGPGPVLPSQRQSDAEFEAQWRLMPLERAVDPREVAAAAAFLLDAPSVTGQMIAVDAGQHMLWAPEQTGAMSPE